MMEIEGANTKAEAEAILTRTAGQADAEIDLAEAALALAALDRPQVPLARYRAHLAELAGDVGNEARAREHGVDQAAALARVLFERYGYEGDRLTYDDLQNANLMRVIDRRKGLPVALGILMIHAARAQGWDMVGLAFPAHFLVRLESGGGRLILDPFAGGRVLGPAELRELLKEVAGEGAELKPSHYEPVGNRAVLLRLQNNLKTRLIQEQKLEAAGRVLTRMLLFAPDEPQLWREAGMLEARVGNLKRAIGLIETYRQKSLGEAQRRQAAVLLQELAQRLH
ncbi:MAG TPA: transglutaminase-like domain-containing protein [Methylomirabilota bacterium]|jgi:regulator of sirC expression with transglutaminase-like and TPR domain|nr:transglutaminase-like domain-containing protein [Methylomirabilota bacterium]